MAKKATTPTKAVAQGKAEQPLLDDVIEQLQSRIQSHGHYGTKLEQAPAGKTILALDRPTQATIVSAALGRLEDLETKIAAFRAKAGDSLHTAAWSKIWNPRWILMETLRSLLRRALPLTEEEVIRLVRWPMDASNDLSPYIYPLAGIATAVEHFAADHEVSPAVAQALTKLARRLRKDDTSKECRQIADRLEALVSGGPSLQLEAGEAWSDAALADLARMKGKAQAAWNALLVHCQTGGKGKFTPHWQKEAAPLLKAVGFTAFKEHVLRWFPLVDKPRTQSRPRRHEYELDQDQLIEAPHVELLRGLAWCCGFQEDADLARAVARLTLSAYRKIPGKGPRLVSLGNGCVTALGMMPGLAPIGQLAILKVKVKFGTAQKEIEKAFTVAATRENLPREEIEELAVPAYGLEEVGQRRETFGEYQAELRVDGGSAGLHWLKGDKPIKSVPAAVKTEHAAEYKELQAAVKDINTMLPAQRERLDSLFLAQKTWPLSVWRERYLDHPLVGTIVRRLIWTFTRKGIVQTGAWHDGELLNVAGKPLKLAAETAVALWHPIGQPVEEVLAWREWLERREVVQPFKQAHREVYLLTDAERRTRVYSNRFAAHILRQHQFHALCAARGWKNRLRLMVDDCYEPTYRALPQWNLRAEYWVEGAGSEYGRDTNDTGVYLYLATDQVRFYRLTAPQLTAHAGGGGYSNTYTHQPAEEPLPLEEIPPLVFSEIMRDVDLFVGVASVGNDPNWMDGRSEGRYHDYWQSYSFGELSATAQTRKTLLERLLPRLKIGPRCNLTDRFLTVRGDLRSYKIHLGSGNILMEPNDQYLCIVPKQSTASSEQVFLPFEGDNTLTIILSKAFLLAADTKITDPTITQQIKRP